MSKYDAALIVWSSHHIDLLTFLLIYLLTLPWAPRCINSIWLLWSQSKNCVRTVQNTVNASHCQLVMASCRTDANIFQLANCAVAVLHVAIICVISIVIQLVIRQ